MDNVQSLAVFWVFSVLYYAYIFYEILLSEIINYAKNAGLHALIAGVDSENEVSLKLHQSFGFVQVAHFKEVGFKFNRWLDLVFLELLLE